MWKPGGGRRKKVLTCAALQGFLQPHVLLGRAGGQSKVHRSSPSVRLDIFNLIYDNKRIIYWSRDHGARRKNQDRQNSTR